ncbi:hypothetical protein DPMN_045102 [Dreissena polymorpha]|uniref:Uncharacterized protein n=1 Tax=Dreissena polymorpha TaxID=45954 RepID=A0A9D4D741_DREPO|nr:hypothetical protein DPMN_045102 [Dreissena polymorpha]
MIGKKVTSRVKLPPPGSHEANVLTKFHENWAKNVTSRVFTCFHYIHIEKNALPSGGHVFSPIWTIFELVQDINKTNQLFTSHVILPTGTIFELNSHIMETNVLTKFHEFHFNIIEKNAPPTGGHVFSLIWTIFELVRDINKTNYKWKTAPHPGSIVIQLTGTIFKLNSHIKETNSVHIEKCPAHWRLCFSPIWTIFELVQDIKKTNILTNFHDDWAKIVTSRVFTSHVILLTGTIFELNSHIKATNAKNVTSRRKCPAPGGHIFKATKTIFKLIQDIIGTNLLTKFHDDRKINVTSRVLTRKIAPLCGGHVFQPTRIVFKLVLDIIGMNLLTQFHEDRTINVASRVKNGPPLGSHVFQAKVTIFKLIQDISGTNLLSKFHEDRKINVASRPYKEKCPAPWLPCFSTNRHHFELVQDIIGMNLLTKFYEDPTITVASRVKNAPPPPPGNHVFQANVTIFELIQDIIETNLLSKFHEDWTIIVASRELTRQMLTPHNAQRTTDKKDHKSSP